ncbi:DUF1851 domain-containing protein [Pseudomonas fluorescens]|uniref:DUF1851 domain-containing protein n=1 Tax=Pseudomonas fluorescens TaxID=294 RepID=A0A1T2YTA7_PSEFL|nr:T6SS immunity protein Tdi1 domain-containing protein [Pseudomonas fluorescens]OPA94843.1 DUF1851 domain-containing protein [Pseudomonas fluorescens]
MYEIFRNVFSSDYRVDNESLSVSAVNTDTRGLAELMLEFGGCSFENALYRVMKPSLTNEWNRTVEDAFPNFFGRVQCFGFDWLGRIFALDSGRLEGGQPGVIMFEPGTGQALEIPCDIVSFHNHELVEYREEALALTFHNQWLARGGAPKYEDCIGYRKPLFLGGQDTVDNLEFSNLDVYWTITGQMIRKSRGLPPGTPLGEVVSRK